MLLITSYPNYGKSTAIKQFHNTLKSNGIPVFYISYPKAKTSAEKVFDSIFLNEEFRRYQHIGHYCRTH